MDTIYKNQVVRFPIIASVIEGHQKGEVFRNKKETHFFVINKFGFCQEFYSEFDEDFFANIVLKRITETKNKLRLYAPKGRLETFLKQYPKAFPAKRISFKLEHLTAKSAPEETLIVKNVEISDLENDFFGLNLCSRYYANKEDFIKNSFAKIALYDNEYAGICYSAGNGINCAETDVFVKEQFRKKNIGKFLVSEFAQECLKNDIEPHWDCYADNTPSVKLAKSCGFKECLCYDFYNITNTETGA
ncbi:MAG: GNAT family N-acetyltransferase [Alphaproteobacteria bacterium]|nr:GNAT family N-acetyltransferase [Alphaproteobacteria bacterium]